jgi:hypothetical protein
MECRVGSVRVRMRVRRHPWSALPGHSRNSMPAARAGVVEARRSSVAVAIRSGFLNRVSEVRVPRGQRHPRARRSTQSQGEDAGQWRLIRRTRLPAHADRTRLRSVGERLQGLVRVVTEIAVDLRHCRVPVRVEVAQGREKLVARRQPVAVDGLLARRRLAARDASYLALPIRLPCPQDPALSRREAGPEPIVVLPEEIHATSRETVDRWVMLHRPIRGPERETGRPPRQRGLRSEQPECEAMTTMRFMQARLRRARRSCPARAD